MKIIKIILPVLWLSFLTACAESTDSILDAAEFAMNSCTTSNTTACTDAITEADKVLASNANNVSAALIKSNALATRAGVDLLGIMSDLTTTGGDSEERKYRVIHDAIVTAITSLTDLRSSITALTGITAPASSDETYKDYYFQLGLLMAIEGFTLPSIDAQPTSGAVVDITATTAIDDTDTANVESDFVNADDNLIIGGIKDSSTTGWEMVDFIREYYCLLRTQAVADGVASGFETAQLRALMRCQLNTEAYIGGLLTNAEFPGTTIVNCTAFVDNQLGSGTTCEDSGDSEL